MVDDDREGIARNLNICINEPDVDLRMGLKDGVRGKALLDQQSDERTDLNEIRFRDIDAFVRCGKGLPVLSVGIGSIIAKTIETTGTDLSVAIAGTGRMIPSVAGEGDGSRAGMSAIAAAGNDCNWYIPEGEGSCDRLGDSSPGRAVKDASLDDLMFIKSDMKVLIRRSHKRYFQSKQGIQIWTKDNDTRRQSKCNLQFGETKRNLGSPRVAFIFSLQEKFIALSLLIGYIIDSDKIGVIELELLNEPIATIDTIRCLQSLSNPTMVNQCNCTDTYCSGCPGM